MQILRGSILEETTYKTICAIDNIPQCNNAYMCNSDRSVYDTNHMILRMILSVKVSTAHQDDLSVAYVGARDRHSRFTPETVGKKFRCGLETAQRTLKTTTQRCVRHSIHPLHRRYCVDHLNLYQKRLQDTFYMDTLSSKVKSLGGYTCAQLITNGTFTKVYSMESKASSNNARALVEFIDNVGVLDSLVCDFASEQTGKHTDVMKLIRQSNIRLHIAEKGRGITQNHGAETEIRGIKTKWKTRMREKGVPFLPVGLCASLYCRDSIASRTRQRPTTWP